MPKVAAFLGSSPVPCPLPTKSWPLIIFPLLCLLHWHSCWKAGQVGSLQHFLPMQSSLLQASKEVTLVVPTQGNSKALLNRHAGREVISVHGQSEPSSSWPPPGPNLQVRSREIEKPAAHHNTHCVRDTSSLPCSLCMCRCIQARSTYLESLGSQLVCFG
jgi:hypothetical protein